MITSNMPHLPYRHPMTKLDPIVSEFATTEEAEAYDAWFRAKIEAAIASDEPDVPHDEVMARMQAILDRRKTA
jgi:hypothetical protein